MAVGAAAIKAGEAFVALTLDDEKFAGSLSKLQRRFGTFSRDLGRIAGGLSGVGAAMLAPFVLGVRNMITWGAEIERAAYRTGIANTEFANLANVAEVTGSSFSALEIGLKTIGERIIQLRAGSGETVTAFQQLGISAKEFINSGSNVDRLVMIGEKIREIGDAGAKSGLALRTLGEAGNQLLPLLQLPNLRQIIETASRLSPTKSELEQSLQIAVGVKLLEQSFRQLSITIASAVSPALIGIGNYLIEISFGLIETARASKDFLRAWFGIGSVLLTVGLGLGLVAAAAVAASGSFALMSIAASALTTALTALGLTSLTAWVSILGPVAYGLALVGAVYLLFLDLAGAFDENATAAEKFNRALGATVGLLRPIAVLLAGMSAAFTGKDFTKLMNQYDAMTARFLIYSSAREKERKEEEARRRGLNDSRTQSIGVLGSLASQQTLGSAGVQSDSESLRELVETSQASLVVQQSISRSLEQRGAL